MIPDIKHRIDQISGLTPVTNSTRKKSHTDFLASRDGLYFSSY